MKQGIAKAIVSDPDHGDVFNCAWGALEIPWSQELDDGPFVVELFALLDNGKQTLVTCVAPAPSLWQWCLMSHDGRLQAVVRNKHVDTVRCTDPLVDGKWHHLAMNFDGQDIHFYVDGRVAKSYVTSMPELLHYPPGLTIGTHLPLFIGAISGGLIKEVRLSHGVATAIPAGTRLKITPDTLGFWRAGDVDTHGYVSNVVGRELCGRLVRLPSVSIDEQDRICFAARCTPLELPDIRLALSSACFERRQADQPFSLDGQWELAPDGDPAVRLAGAAWSDAIIADVPGSVHAALEKAGTIPDPKFGRNDAIAREKSFHTWWFRRRFRRPDGDHHRLVFDGVAIKCTVWLNGHLAGKHEGMFGGPEFDIDRLLKDDNELVVQIDPAPYTRSWRDVENQGWRETVAFNCVYGWHYCNIPALGIWRNVRIETTPVVKLVHPFIATRDSHKGEISICVDLRGPGKPWAGQLQGYIVGENFAAAPLHFDLDIDCVGEGYTCRLDLSIPDPHLWWPNGVGDPNLYRLVLQFTPDTGRPDQYETTFGLRTIEMLPLPGGPCSTEYNWTFVINGRPMFMKGAGWCTMDSSMDFRRTRYAHFLQLAKDEHCQILRAWGGGMPESDDFYDLCDRLGIAVIQEWPTAWNSHITQPYDALEETVRRNTLRLRNHPSLFMWGAGNESSFPYGKAIDMMGRLSIELDGTRPFHRGEPYGGSFHAYPSWWDRKNLDANFELEAAFLGEFGMASLPVMESVERYLPDEEKTIWPPLSDGVLMHHMPTFNTMEDWDRLSCATKLLTDGRTMSQFIESSQLVQVVVLRHVLEKARTRWPDATGALFYKINDNYPGVSWSTIDWYGACKLAHWFVQDALTPLHACVIFDRFNSHGEKFELPVFLLDDAGVLRQRSWQVRTRVYDQLLNCISEHKFHGDGLDHTAKRIGELKLPAKLAATAPLFVVVEILHEEQLLDRTFYFVNLEVKKDCLYQLPPTALKWRTIDGKVVVTNVGNLPAVGVMVSRPGHLDTFTAGDNCFWLDIGQSQAVTVSHSDKLRVTAWNAPIDGSYMGI